MYFKLRKEKVLTSFLKKNRNKCFHTYTILQYFHNKFTLYTLSQCYKAIFTLIDLNLTRLLIKKKYKI